MKVDLDKYIINKDFIQKWFLDNNPEDIAKAVATMACATMVPCIVAAFYIGEVASWPQPLLDHIQTLIKFYKYTEIVGIPVGFPNVNSLFS